MRHGHHIQLEGSTTGLQHAGWTPRAVAMERGGLRALTGLRIPVQGGGYAPVIVERRGMGRSTGTAGVFFGTQDVDDHEASIAWAAAQPWCNGEVVLFGTSYYGMTQPLVAARRPPALRAFSANEMCTDFYRHLVQFGGVPGLYFLDVWMGANFTSRRFAERMSPGRRALISHVTNGPLHPLVEAAVHKNVDRMFAEFMSATPVESVREMYVNWMFDGKTRATSSIPEGSTGVLDRIEVPFTVVQNVGYFNLHQFGSYDLFENAGTPEDRRWLIVGPPMFDLPVYAWQGEALAFFDHVLRGTDNGFDEQPRVRYWVEGAEAFAPAIAFPPPQATAMRLYLDAGGSSVHHLRREAPPAGSASWVAAPTARRCCTGSRSRLRRSSRTSCRSRRRRSSQAPSRPTSSSAATRSTRTWSRGCPASMRTASGTTCRWARSGPRHAPWTPPGRRPSRSRSTRTSEYRWRPASPWCSLTPAPTRLLPGDVLRLDVASRTDLLRMSPADGYAQFDLPVPPYLSRNTLHHGESWIEVHAVGTDDDEETGP